MSHNGIGVTISTLSNNMVSQIESCIIFLRGRGTWKYQFLVLNDT